MNLNIKTTNMTLTPDVSEYLERKLRMIKGVNLDQDNVLIHAELGKTSKHHKSGDFYKAEINLKIGGTDYFAASETEDLHASIDEVKDTLGAEIHKHFSKKTSLFRRGARKVKNILRFGKRGENM